MKMISVLLVAVTLAACSEKPAPVSAPAQVSQPTETSVVAAAVAAYQSEFARTFMQSCVESAVESFKATSNQATADQSVVNKLTELCNKELQKFPGQ
jgi:hypothetical protein